MKYNILWIDDECDQLLNFIQLAEMRGIKLKGYKSYEEAFNLPEMEIFSYDAILLDAKFYLYKNQVPGTEDLLGISEAVKKIHELRAKKYFPVFILSGQTNIANDQTFREIFGEHYRKHEPESVNKLLRDIRYQIEQRPYIEIKHKYSDVLEVFTNGLLDSNLESELIQVILNSDGNTGEDIKGNLSILRGILEAIHNSLRSDMYNIIPQGMTKFKEINKHLSGNPIYNTSVRTPTTFEYQNNAIENLANALYYVSGQYIHNIEDQKYIISHYAVKSLLFDLLEILLWYKKLINNLNKK